MAWLFRLGFDWFERSVLVCLNDQYWVYLLTTHRKINSIPSLAVKQR